MKVAICLPGACTLYYMMTDTYSKLFEVLERNGVEYDIYICLCTYTQLSVKNIDIKSNNDKHKLNERLNTTLSILQEEYSSVLKDANLNNFKNRRLFGDNLLVCYELSPQSVENHFRTLLGDRVKFIYVENDNKIKDKFNKIIMDEGRDPKIIGSGCFLPEPKRYIIAKEIERIQEEEKFKYTACISFRPDTIFRNVSDKLIDVIKIINLQKGVFTNHWNTSGIGSKEYPHIRTDYFIIAPLDSISLMSEKIQLSNEIPTRGYTCLTCMRFYKEFSHLKKIEHNLLCCGNKPLEAYCKIKLDLNPELGHFCHNCKRMYIYVSPEVGKVQVVHNYKKDIMAGTFKTNLKCCGETPEPGPIHPEQKYARRFIRKVPMIPMEDSIIEIDMNDTKRFWNLNKINLDLFNKIKKQIDEQEK